MDAGSACGRRSASGGALGASAARCSAAVAAGRPELGDPLARRRELGLKQDDLRGGELRCRCRFSAWAWACSGGLGLLVGLRQRSLDLLARGS